MPGEFYIENKAERLSLKGIENAIAELAAKLDTVKSQTDKLAGQNPVEGSVARDWQVAETNLVSIGAVGIRNKIHDLTLSILNLAGTQITIRLYKTVNGIERKVYEQVFDAVTEPPGLSVINGSWAIHNVLRVTLQSNDVADNGKSVDYDYMLEAM